VKKITLLLSIPLLSQALTLTTVLESVQNNDLVESKKASSEAEATQLEILDSAYLPKLEAAGMYRYLRDEDKGFFDPEYSANVSASYVVFDGFKKHHLSKAQSYKLDASQALLAHEKARLGLQSIKLFFNLRTQEAVIKASEQKIAQLQNELKRLQKLFDARIVQEDALENVKAALAMSDYDLQLQKQNHTSLRFNLQTLTHSEYDQAEAANFKEPEALKAVDTQAVKARQFDVNALNESAKAQTSAYWPTLVVKDTLTYTSYYEETMMPGVAIPETMNKLEVIASMTLWDFGAKLEERQKLMLQKKALASVLAYEKKAQSSQQKLALISLNTGKEKIRSASLNLSASEKAYNFRAKSFKANLIDSSNYLDALTRFTQAKALYEQSINDYEIAKANYYFNHDLPLKDQIK
jgi:outer membrane protein TolC